MKLNKAKLAIATVLCICAMTVALIATSCTTSSQRTAYTTIFSVEQTATATVDGYFALVIKGTLTTNSVPLVSKSFNDLQAACKIAADASEFGTNALAPASLTIEAADLGTLINNIELTTKK